MEKRDAKLIEELVETDRELKGYVDDHVEFEKNLWGIMKNHTLPRKKRSKEREFKS